MINILKKTLVYSMLVLFTASCSSEVETEDEKPLESQEQVEVREESEQPVVVVDNKQVAEPKDALDGYPDINDDPRLTFITILQLAQLGDAVTDEEKLYAISDEYREESDAFKKQDLTKSLLPKVNAQIDEYKNGYRIKIPVVSDISTYHEKKQYDKDFNYVFVAGKDFRFWSYEFDKKAFTTYLCQQGRGFDITIRNIYLNKAEEIHNILEPEISVIPKGVLFEENNRQPSCRIVVTDEAQAKKIEEARANDLLEVKGYGYFDIPVIKGQSNLLLTPVLMDLTYYNKDTNETLLTKKLTW